MHFIHRIRTHFLGRVATLALATAWFAALSVALLPLATRVLHASDYGAYALLMSVVAFVGTAMDGGASLIVPASYKSLNSQGRGRLITSVVVVACIGASLTVIVLGIAWAWYQRKYPSLDIMLPMILVAAAIIPSRVTTNILITAFSVTGRSNAIAAQMIAQATAIFVASLVALFVFSMGGISLFIGALCGQLAALSVCLIVLWRYREFSFPSSYWMRRSVRAASTSGALGIVTGARGVAEASMIVNELGLRAAGNYSHARLYYNLLTALSNAISHNIRSKSLDEAFDLHSNFSATLRTWPPVQIAFTFAGVVFVFFGEEIVGAISYGKLVEAAAYVPAFFIIALIQTTEQPAEAAVYASGRASSATRFRTVAMLGSLIFLFPIVFAFGIPGVLMLGIVEQLAYRIYLRRVAGDDRVLPFGDGVAIVGCLTIVAAKLYVFFAAPQIEVELFLLMLAIPIVALVGGRSIKDMYGVISRFIKSLI